MYVLRETYHPKEDIKRNWSAMLGGWDNDLVDIAFETEEEAREADEMQASGGLNREYRFHPAYGGFVLVHYEGLGAVKIDAESLEEAKELAAKNTDALACTLEEGDGWFDGEDVISFHKIADGRYLFEVKDY